MRLREALLISTHGYWIDNNGKLYDVKNHLDFLCVHFFKKHLKSIDDRILNKIHKDVYKLGWIRVWYFSRDLISLQFEEKNVNTRKAKNTLIDELIDAKTVEKVDIDLTKDGRFYKSIRYSIEDFMDNIKRM